jgi:hypothetical protein
MARRLRPEGIGATLAAAAFFAASALALAMAVVALPPPWAK